MMRKRRLLSIFIVIFLLQGCGANSENTDTSQIQNQTKDGVAEFVSENAADGDDRGQTEEKAAGGSSGEQTETETDGGNDTEQTKTNTADAGETKPTNKDADVPYMEAYQQFLEIYLKENKNTGRARAMLAFIDDDTVPELLLIEDNIHASGVTVYACVQGTVTELGSFGSMGMMQYVERGGMILSPFTGMGEIDAAFYQVKDGKAKQICAMRTYQPFDGNSDLFEIDGVSVTETTYHKKWRELYDTDSYVVTGYDDAFSLQEMEPAELLAKAVDGLLLQKGSAGLAKLVEEQAEALEGYAAFLEEYEPQCKGEQEPRFALLFLDGDEVPELIVMEGWAHTQGASVYLFQDGEVIAGEGKESPRDTYYVNGKEMTEEQYQKVSDWWAADEYQMIEYDHFRVLPKTDIRKELQEELEERILMREDVLKQNLLLAAGAQESDILLFEYDDYDGDGKYEAFMICGNAFESSDGISYKNETLWFAGADGCTSQLSDPYNSPYRMIDGKMDFGLRKYLFFYLDTNLTANISVLWTVRDGKPIEESNLFQSGQVVYRDEGPREDFEIWVDGYNNYCEPDGLGKDDPLWTGHTWRPYFYHYDTSDDQIKAYGGEEITKEAFAKLSGTDIIEEMEAKGYTIGEIIHWGNDIVTINYHEVELWGVDESEERYVYENVIWDNRVKDYWRKDERGVTSWENAGEGGSF